MEFYNRNPIMIVWFIVKNWWCHIRLGVISAESVAEMGYSCKRTLMGLWWLPSLRIMTNLRWLLNNLSVISSPNAWQLSGMDLRMLMLIDGRSQLLHSIQLPELHHLLMGSWEFGDSLESVCLWEIQICISGKLPFWEQYLWYHCWRDAYNCMNYAE